jgi:hypothetical protein
MMTTSDEAMAQVRAGRNPNYPWPDQAGRGRVSRDILEDRYDGLVRAEALDGPEGPSILYSALLDVITDLGVGITRNHGDEITERGVTQEMMAFIRDRLIALVDELGLAQ